MRMLSGNEGISSCLTIIGGDKGAQIGAPIIFKNSKRSYLIREAEQKIGACDRTGRTTLEGIFFEDERSWGVNESGEKRFLWMDNCSAHNFSGK